MNTPRLRSLALVLVVVLLAASVLACDLGGGAAKPTITITAPTSDAQFQVGEEVNVLSSANDAKGITRVELLVDGELYRTDSSPSAEGETSLAMAQTWRAADPGMHTLSVIAYNVDGTASEPWAVTIEVVAAGGVVTPPTPTSPGPPPAATNTPPPPPEATATTPPPPEDTPEPELPDLYISEIRVQPQEPEQGSPAMAGVRIHNGGTVDSGPFRVVWRYAGEHVGCEWEVANLAPGAAQWQQCDFTYPTWSTYTTTGVVDVDGDVDEVTEDNNELTLVVVVHGAAAAAPDLHITEIRYSPDPPVQGSSNHVGVQVHNQGGTAAGSFKVVWRSGEPGAVLEWTMSSLAPGASAWAEWPYTYIGHGHFNTTAEVDSDGAVDEMDEDNNEASRAIDVVPS
jgi:hypothetical protein